MIFSYQRNHLEMYAFYLELCNILVTYYVSDYVDHLSEFLY